MKAISSYVMAVAIVMAQVAFADKFAAMMRKRRQV
jgi:hypothetical protein